MSIDVKFKNKPKILGLDISTKTIGFALFDISGSKLLELTHFSPKIKPQPEDKLEELMMKANTFQKHLEGYKGMGITRVIIEEPLLNSNNVYTVGTKVNLYYSGAFQKTSIRNKLFGIMLMMCVLMFNGCTIRMVN